MGVAFRRTCALITILPAEYLDRLQLIDDLVQHSPEERHKRLNAMLMLNRSQDVREEPVANIRPILEALITKLNNLLLGPILFVPKVFPDQVPLDETLIAKAYDPNLANMERTEINRELLATAINDSIKRVEVVTRKPEERGPVTDVYIMSHSRHRIFFSTVSTYDRLYSRFRFC